MSAELRDPLVDNSAVALSRAIRAGDVSCVEVVTAHLDRMAAVDGDYHAMVSQRPRDVVLAEAAERDAELAGGRYRGWLHGLPHAVKDLADVCGLPTTSGLWPVSTAPVAEVDDPFVARIRAAGAVFVGKTNTPELGLGSHTYNTVAPTTGNVADARRSAGGSSGGAAVAVASGLVPVADGSDFMGSLRNPPGWNGVLGLRPTPGVILERDEDPLAPGSGVNGPIARTVADLAALLATMAEPGWALTSVQPSRPRIGWLGDLGGTLTYEDGVTASCLTALDRWDADIDDARIPAPERIWPLWLVVRHHEVGRGLLGAFSPVERRQLKPEAQWEMRGAESLTADQVAAAGEERARLRADVLALFAAHDVLALPTAQVWPFPATQHWPAEIDGQSMDTYHRWMQVTTLATLAGLPALAVPGGVNDAGLAMGVQLIGRPGDEAQLLAFAAEAERNGAFEVRRPTQAAPRRASPPSAP